MSDEFLNGYHFVPRKAPDKESWLKDQGDVERNLKPYDGEKAASFGLTPGTLTDGHAVYAPGRHSGRITCTVELECPTVIGAKRYSGGDNAKRYAVVDPFLYRSRPAIPATSLKGLISSIAEAASRSAYRALGDSTLTVAYSPNGNPMSSWDYAVSGERGKIGTTHDYFRDIENPDAGRRDNTLPFTLTRSDVSPAEAMFGYVRSNESGKPAKNRLVAVAGKLRFGLAVPCGEWAAKAPEEFFVAKTSFEGEDYSGQRRGGGYVRLKEMGEPMKKPQGLKGPRKFIKADLRSATPTMYFVKKDDPAGPISKEKFANTAPDAFRAQGGKFYLHHVDAASGEPWATKVSAQDDYVGGSGGAAAGRKSAVRPLRAGVTFRFHVDFDNLTDRELNLLCFALQPSTAFRHKIGMGKGIGLGSIEIVPEAMRIVDRAGRYSADGILAEDTAGDGRQELQDIQRRAQAHRDWLERSDKAALNALLKIGETHPFGKTGEERARMKPVLWVPLARGAFDGWKAGDQGGLAEQKSFQWFSNNESWFAATGQVAEGPQKLTPIPVDGQIPRLRSNTMRKPGSGATKGYGDGPARHPPRANDKQMRAGVVATGTLKPAAGKSYRFITPAEPGYKDVFVPPSDARALVDAPDHARVEFLTAAGDKGIVATKIRRLP
jgi:CRISPR/Cas system CSM-associated protein Csm3 (group 7 of RAMP superfamily)/cold shock CspA family protein